MKRIILLPLLVFSLAAFSQGVIKLNANSSFDLNGFNLTITNGAQIIFRWTPDSSSNRVLNNFGGGGGSTPTLNQYQIGVGSGSNLLTGTSALTYQNNFVANEQSLTTAGYTVTASSSPIAGFQVDGGTAEIRHLAASGGYFPTFYSNGGEAMRIDNVRRVGIGVTSPTAWLHLPAANSSYASLRIPAGTAPSSPNAGDMYFDGTHLYYRIGSTWYQLDQQSGGGSLDATPTDGSTAGVESNGVFDALATKVANPLTTLGDVFIGGASGVPARRAIGSDYQQFLSFGGQPIWSWPRFYPARSIVATDANVSANPGTTITLRAGILTANRTIEVSSLLTENDYLEIHNNQSGFTWSFTGQPVYLSDRTTTVSALSANTIYQIRYVDAKLVIIN